MTKPACADVWQGAPDFPDIMKEETLCCASVAAGECSPVVVVLDSWNVFPRFDSLNGGPSCQPFHTCKGGGGGGSDCADIWRDDGPACADVRLAAH